jgi:hypothetical protein
LTAGPLEREEPPAFAQRNRGRLALGGAIFLFAALCLQVLLSFLPRGLWEDGYFFIRYARNTWAHGVMAWNPSDGPVHGMTSQLYQWLITIVYPAAPDHMVTVAKAIAAAALAGAALCLFRLGGASQDRAGSLVLPFLGLGLPLVLNHVPTGLETIVVLLWLGLWTHEYVSYRQGRSSAARMALFVVVTYLLRPDAVLIPLAALLPCLRDRTAVTVKAYALAGAGLLLCLLFFKLYYGTALPLSFYVKSYLATQHSSAHVAIFMPEKLKNVLQFLYFYAPFFLITLVGRSSSGLALLAAGMAFCAYHTLFTVETMGHFSRFYIPAVVPIVAAAVLSWSRFRATAPAWLPVVAIVLWAASYGQLKGIDARSHVPILIKSIFEYPYLIALCLTLLPIQRLAAYRMGLAVAVLTAGTFYNYRAGAGDLALRDDRTILLQQIAPRRVFQGLVPLSALNPRHVYHTDMGAPGVLLPEAKVTDLDGLLNEELTIAHVPFQRICERDRPEAIFLHDYAYPHLRAEIHESACFRDYQPVMTQESILHVRKDLVKRFEEARRAGR